MSRPSTVSGPLRGLYKLFSSVSLTIFLLVVLAATSIIGTLVPQNKFPEVYFRAFGDFFFKLFSALNIFDMYHSWWFQLLLVLLALNIVICSIDRLPGVWKVVFNVRSRFNAAPFKNNPGGIEFLSVKPAEEMQATVQTLIARSFGHTQVTPTEKGMMVFGEKWRWSRLGIYIVHLSVLLLLIGGMISSLLGFDGFVQIHEAETINTIRLHNTGEIYPLPFKIRCDANRVDFYQNGAPKEFRSDLAIIEADREVIQKAVIVNDPLRYAGINFFLSSYGEVAGQQTAPEVIPAPTEVLLKLTIVASGQAYRQKTKIGEPFDLPEGMGQFLLTEFRENGDFMGQPIGETLMGILTPPNGPPVAVSLPIRFANFDKMRQGQIFISVLAPTAHEKIPAPAEKKSYYMVLQVTKDPGVWIVYTGFILMLAGCVITFFMPHQQLLVEITSRGQKSHIFVAGTMYRNKLAMQRRVHQLAEKLGDGTAEETSTAVGKT